MNTTRQGNEFEELVLSIIKKTRPSKAELYRGGADRGCDILVTYEHNGVSKKVIIECKNHNSPLSQKDINSSINWAVAKRPDLYYIWTSNYITPSTKDYLNLIAKQYKLRVMWEEEDSVEEFINAYKLNDQFQFEKLRERIFNVLGIDKLSSQLEYTSYILPSNHELINRINERRLLVDNKKHCFYLVGPSCVGKTQLAKSIAKHYYDSNYFVFWHRVLVQDNNGQIQNLLESLGTFFSCVLKRNELNEYLNDHGFFITASLLNIVKAVLSKYKCALFFDDIHKCNVGNSQYLEFLIQLFEIDQCRFYLLGWFNVFDLYDLKILNLVNYLDVEPLSAQHIRQIALNIDKTLNEIELEKIVKKSNGLPGLAEILPINKEDNDFEGLTSYFRTIISTMDIKEKALLYALSISRVSLPIGILETIGYHIACEKLTQKRITQFEGENITLHDKYKEHIKELLFMMPEETKEILKSCVKVIPLLYIDLLVFLCNTNRIDEFDMMLKSNFSYLLSMGYEVMLLDVIQKREKSNKRNALELIVKKMILLERKSEYGILENYINITKDIISESNDDFFMWNYIYIRFKYFTSDFVDLLNMFYANFTSYQKYPQDIYFQILFIIGRVYFVMGDMRTAAEIYFYIYNLSVRNNLPNLSTKAIHRICIIEEKLGLYNDAIQSLKELVEDYHFVSAKRLSFAFYRLGKCELKNQNYKKAIYYNEKSMDIKESINSERGLVFSMKLYSQIYYAMSDYSMAMYWAEEALNKAKTIKISKEIVATEIVYAQVLLSTGQKQLAISILKDAIDRAGDLHLCHRLKVINALCKKFQLIELNTLAEKTLLTSEKILSDMKASYQHCFADIVHANIDLNRISELFDKREALSPKLLLL